MRLFQNSGVPARLLSSGNQESQRVNTFSAQVTRFLDSRYGALHFLAPVLAREESAFFTNGDDRVLQRSWAREMGMSRTASLTDILLAQIESHRTEVFYNIDPVRYDSEFVRRLPGCVRRTVAWRAAPPTGADFGGYDLVVCNFANILRSYRERGWKTAYFAPAHDAAMDEYGGNDHRPIDVLFVGGYSRHHMKRAAVLEAVAGLRDRYRIEFRLALSRLTRMAESPLRYLAPVGKYRCPRNIRAVSREPLFGRDLYALISKSKIVLNGAVDVSDEDRGNMRCFEAMGCGALLLSDRGVYPEGMIAGKTLVTYRSAEDASQLVQRILSNWGCHKKMAGQANRMVRSLYSKENQWTEFSRLVS